MPQQIKLPVILPIQGLDISLPGEYIDQRGTPDCSNIELYRSVLKKRGGTTAVGTTASQRILGIKELFANSTYYPVRIGTTAVQSLSAGTWGSIAGSALNGDDTSRVDISVPLLSGARVLVYSNFIDNIRKWTGTGNDSTLIVTPATDKPLAKYMIAYSGYLVLFYVSIGGTVYQQRGYWSDTGDITNFQTGNSGYMDLIEDGEDITGAALFGNYIAVHKESSIYLWYLVNTDDIFAAERKSTGAGAISHFTIQNLPTGDQMFLARDGFHLFNGVSAPLINLSVMDEIRESMNPEYVYRCWSCVIREKDEYWCGVPIGSQTEAETVYKYNYRTGQMYRDARTGISAVGSYTLTTSKSWAEQIGDWQSAAGTWDDVSLLKLFPPILFGDNTGITTRREDVNNDNNVAISSYWTSKDYEAVDSDKGKLGRWTKLMVWAKGSSLTIEYSINEGQSWIAITTLALTVSYPTDAAPAIAYFDVVSSKIRFRFSNNIAGEVFYLKQFVIWHSAREMVK